MKIKLRISPRSKTMDLDIADGTNLGALAARFEVETPYRILAAKVDNKLEDLNKTLQRPCTVELLDLRTPAANLIYQHSLTLIYLKAVDDVMGKQRVVIRNSLNKGIYTKIDTSEPPSEQEVLKIEERMHQIVKEDIPFIRSMAKREEAFKMLVADGQIQKSRLLEANEDVEWVKFYSLGNYRDFFYGLMVPSTRYIELFELRKYKNGLLLRFPHPSAPNEIPPYKDEVKLYKAFKEATKWAHLMDISYVADLNEKIQKGQHRELIQLSEALHEKKVAEIADRITHENKRIVLIAGPSSSGKTTFAKRLCIQLRVNGKHPLYLSTDDYFVERNKTPLDEHGDPDYEGLSAIEVKMFNDHMNALLGGQAVDLPSFDFIEGTKRFDGQKIMLPAGEPIVIEGIHALNEAMTPDILAKEKFKIYISPFTQLHIDDHNRIPVTDGRMLRRMVRDFQFRGNSACKTIATWPKVRAGEDINIFPYSNDADVFFNSAYIYELAILKKYAWPLLNAITQDEPQYSEAVRMLKFLRFFETIEDDSIISNNSIMREFIGGSIFV